MSLYGDVRPRAECPSCGRSTSVTFNARTGEAYLRSHNDVTAKKLFGKSKRCSMSTRPVPPEAVHQPKRTH